MTPLEKAIRAVGSQSNLAKAIGQSPQFIFQMKKRGGQISTRVVSPDAWVKATGLSKKELFPEYYT